MNDTQNNVQFKEITTLKSRILPIVFSSAVLACFIAFISSVTATLLGGLIEEMPRTPRDEILFIIYLTPLLIWIPSVFYLSTRKWQKIERLNKTIKRIRIYKLASLIVVGACCGMLTRLCIRLASHSFDHELPAAGVLCLFGSFCFIELLKEYKPSRKESVEEQKPNKIRQYVITSISFLIVTIGLIVYLISIGKIR